MKNHSYKTSDLIIISNKTYLYLTLIESGHAGLNPGDGETPDKLPVLLLEEAAELLLVVRDSVLLPPGGQVGDLPQPRQLHPGQLRPVW